MNEFMRLLTNQYFHAVNFDFNGVHYCFSGWWLLDWETADKEYETKEAFMHDPFFDGKTIGDISDEIENADFEMNPGYNQ